MEFETTKVAGDVVILSRSPFEGIAKTLTFGEGVDVIPAGSVIDTDGAVLGEEGTVEGILLHDVAKERPQGTVLKKAYINTAVAEAHASVEYDAGVKAALPMIVFE